MTNLQSLQIDSGNNITEDGLRTLCRLPNLRRLYVGWSCEILPECTAAVEIFSSCPKLCCFRIGPLRHRRDGVEDCYCNKMFSPLWICREIAARRRLYMLHDDE